MQNRAESFLDWLGIAQPPKWTRSRALGGFCGFLLVLVCALLFGSALIAAFFIIWSTIGFLPELSALQANSQAGRSPNLGAGALLAAALGAPFVIWATVIKHHALRYQKEGHITDRINKAVEQLGSIRVEEQIGRSVTFWFGPATRYDVSPDKLDAYSKQPRRTITQRFNPREEDGQSDLAMVYDVEVRPFERTVIEWEGKPLKLDEGEIEGHTGEWSVFKRTKPNLELRIGAILSLERIAQDSTRYDGGRDHIRVMEILSAYIRENLPPADISNVDQSFPDQPARADIQMAIDIIKRRSASQLAIEKAAKYRLDLSKRHFVGVDFSKGTFVGADLTRCRFSHCSMHNSDFSGASFLFSVIDDSNFARRLKLVGAHMDYCKFGALEGSTNSFFFAPQPEELKGLTLMAADLSRCHISTRRFAYTYGTRDTLLPELAESERAAQRITIWNEQEEGQPISLSAEPFKNWSPYTSADMANGSMLDDYYAALELKEWPFVND